MVPNVTPAEVLNRLIDSGLVLLDVREQHEVDFCRIEGSLHIPLGQVKNSALEQLNPGDEVVVYCHLGSRSLIAARILLGLGFQQVSNLAGGIDAWSVYVDPSIPRY